jgi:S1-C subfamily serine protease
MAESNEWAFPAALQPRREQWSFDLETALQAVVMVHSEIPEDAFTASILGTERVGSGVVIGADGLVVTIGYLITEASSIWLTTHSGAVTPGHALAYDQTSGFGLVLPLGRLDAVGLERGTSGALQVSDDVIVLGYGGLQHCLNAKVIAKREFAGHWEYVLDEALFTAPPHPQWGGTALLSTSGRLVGVGSLLVQEAVSGESFDANMFVPIDLLEPVLDEMITFGQPTRPPRPWLGLYATELKGRLVISAVTQGGPAHRAGMRAGDFVLEVAGAPIATLPELFRSIWRLGPAGTEIPLTVGRGAATSHVRVRSADRNAYLMKPRQH